LKRRRVGIFIKAEHDVEQGKNVWNPLFPVLVEGVFKIGLYH